MGELGIPGANDTVYICHGDCMEDAERLAGMGLHPEDAVEAETVEPAEREALARAWMQAAEVDAALTMEQGRVRA